MSNKTPIQMALDRVLELAQKHPYKVKGNHDTYSQYNEAWSDFADLIEQQLTDLLPAERDCIKKAYLKGVDAEYGYCQSLIEGSEKPCEKQCTHCKEYYAPLEKQLASDYFNETFKS